MGHHDELCASLNADRKRFTVRAPPLVVGHINTRDDLVGVSKDHAVTGEVFHRLGNPRHSCLHGGADVVAHHGGIGGKSAIMDVSTRALAHVSHHTKVHVRAGASDQLLAG